MIYKLLTARDDGTIRVAIEVVLARVASDIMVFAIARGPCHRNGVSHQ